MISIICPIYNEEKYIAQCIDSVLAQDYPQKDVEVLFVDGMSNDHTREIVQYYIHQYPHIRLVDNPHRTVPYAMNIGIKEAKGDIIIRVDAHAQYPTNYFSALVNGLHKYNADNVGAQCRTLPSNNSASAIAIAESLSSAFGVGNSMFRIGINHDVETDTVPFGCFKKEIFEKVGLYDTELIRNQDDELNARIIKHGGKIVLLADIIFDYYARDSYAKLYKMYYQYGLYKPLVNKKLGNPATLRQFIPPLFVIGIVLGGILSVLVPYFYIPYIAILLLYLITGTTIGVGKAKKHNRFSLICLMPITYAILHIAYGIGYIHGILKILFKQSFNAISNR